MSNIVISGSGTDRNSRNHTDFSVVTILFTVAGETATHIFDPLRGWISGPVGKVQILVGQVGSEMGLGDAIEHAAPDRGFRYTQVQFIVVDK